MTAYRNDELLVLVVSDDHRWRSACADICLARCCNVHTASNGFQGLDNLRKHRYDAVILDDSIVDFSAFEFHLHLKELASNDPAVLVAGAETKSFARLKQSDGRWIEVGTHGSILERIEPMIQRVGAHGTRNQGQ